MGEYIDTPSHHTSVMTLAKWLEQHSIVGLSGVDTRAITEIVREHGTLTGRIEFLDAPVHVETVQEPEVIPAIKRFVSNASSNPLEVLVIDCGVKTNQLRCLLDVGLNITVQHHSVKLEKEAKYDGIFISNGPGDPKDYRHVIDQLQQYANLPMFGNPKHFVLILDLIKQLGICLGHQLLALASGLDTVKMK